MLDYPTILLFGCLLLIAVLLSQLTERSILSASVLFLVAGFLSGEGMLGLMVMDAEQQMLSTLADLTLFTVLFTDSMRLGVKDLTSAWRLPGRALFWGMPLTLLFTGLLAHYAAGLGWLEAFLVGAVLSPTDPVFASAIVGREEIPNRLRHLLNVESGLNDGLALPIVVALLAHLGPKPFDRLAMAEEVALGIVLGFLVPWLAIHIEQSRYFSVAKPYEPLFSCKAPWMLFTWRCFISLTRTWTVLS